VPDTKKLWLPLSDGYRTDNVAQELKEPHSMLSLYRELLKIRKASSALQTGKYIPIEDAPENCFVYLREIQGERVLIALNFSSEAQTILLSRFSSPSILLSTFLDREGKSDSSSLELRSNEGLILKID
jgi:alpha-glucosidase